MCVTTWPLAACFNAISTSATLTPQRAHFCRSMAKSSFRSRAPGTTRTSAAPSTCVSAARAFAASLALEKCAESLFELTGLFKVGSVRQFAVNPKLLRGILVPVDANARQRWHGAIVHFLETRGNIATRLAHVGPPARDDAPMNYVF